MDYNNNGLKVKGKVKGEITCDGGRWRLESVSQVVLQEENVFVHENNYKHSVDVLKIPHTNSLPHTFFTIHPIIHTPPGFSYHTMQTNEPSD